MVSRTTYVVCVNCIHKCGNLKLIAGFKLQIFGKLFVAIFRNIFSYFILLKMFDLGFDIRFTIIQQLHNFYVQNEINSLKFLRSYYIFPYYMAIKKYYTACHLKGFKFTFLSLSLSRLSQMNLKYLCFHVFIL